MLRTCTCACIVLKTAMFTLSGAIIYKTNNTYEVQIHGNMCVLSCVLVRYCGIIYTTHNLYKKTNKPNETEKQLIA